MTLMGLECEIPHIPQSTARLVDWCDVDVHDDGSIRNENFVIDQAAILPMMSLKHGRFIYPSGALPIDHYGAEIVTQPYEYADLHRHASRMAKMFGHVPTTPRASIHVHVDMIDRNWRYVQNLLAWFLHLEAPLFRLSALGEQHRGNQWFADPQHPERGRFQQDHNYARPLSDPIGIRRGIHTVPLIDAPRLLGAKSASEMVAAWGRLDLVWSILTRYCPHRLHALNIVPLMLHHTVEWRLFNGRYRFLPKVLEIINGVHMLAEKPIPRDFPFMPLGSTPDFTAADMSNLIEVDVAEIWGSQWIAPCRERAIKSHYRGEDFFAPALRSRPLSPIFNNASITDMGQSDFCFGVSGTPRGLQRAGRARMVEAVHEIFQRRQLEAEVLEDYVPEEEPYV